jgi:hypothetical protein
MKGRKIKFYSCLLATAALSFSPAGKPSKQGKNTQTFFKDVPMGSVGPTQIGDSIIVFAGVLRAGDFFEGLQARQAERGRAYYKGSQQLQEFPRRMSVEMDVSITRKEVASEEEAFSNATGLLSKVRITAKWKDGFKYLDVKSVRWAFRPISTEEWRARPSTKLLERLGVAVGDPPNNKLWNLEVTIEDEHVALTDSLVVFVSYEEKQLGRMSARL